MIRLRHKLFLQLFRLLDIGMMAVTLFGLIMLVAEEGDPERILTFFRVTYRPVDVLAVVALLTGWAIILDSVVQYDTNRWLELRSRILSILKATLLSSLVLAVVGQVMSVGRFNRTVIILFWLITSGLGVLSRVLLILALRMVRRSGMNSRHVLIIGNQSAAEDLANRIERHSELGYHIEGILLPSGAALEKAPASRWPVLGTMAELQQILQKGVVDEVIKIPVNMADMSDSRRALQLGRELGVVVRLLPDKQDFSLLAQAQVEMFEGQPVITFFREAMLWHLLAKRLLDILVSGFLLVVLSPLLVVVGLLVKATSPGPAIFSQERIGMNRRRFRMHKFRSMYRDAEQRRQEVEHLNEMKGGPVFKILNDPRITPLGRIIRQSSLDELPQLWNVFKGEMSLVGPRPPLPSEVRRYEWADQRRLSIRPGITCLWQIGGRSQLDFEQWMELDRQYIENWTFWLDLEILITTIPVVLLRKGAA